MLKNCKVDFLGNSEVAFFLYTLYIGEKAKRVDSEVSANSHFHNNYWWITLIRLRRHAASKCPLVLNNVCLDFQVLKTDDGLEAITFTAQGDMRQVLYVWYMYTQNSGFVFNWFLFVLRIINTRLGTGNYLWRGVAPKRKAEKGRVNKMLSE
jgi:hypothetical protein